MPDKKSLSDLNAEHGPLGRVSTPELVALDSVTPQSIAWLWHPCFALGKLSLLAGDPGLGKSLVTLAIASCVSLGGRWPASRETAPVGKVILLSAEDDPEDTIRPRLDAAEADCGRIVALTMVTERDAKTGETRRRGFSLVDDIAVLEAAIKQHPECRLVIIDPVSAYLGAVDSHKNAEIRGVLAPLAELAQRAKVAVLAVTHLNKGSGRAIYRAMGSIAFVAAARSTFIVVKDDDDPQRRLMVTLKNNLAADQIGFAYRVETAPNGAPVVMWEPESFTVDLDDLLGDGPGDQATKRDNAGEWLSALLINGPVLRDEIYERAEKAGIKDHTLRRAKQANKAIKAKRKGFGGRWYWGFEDDFPGKDKPVPTVTEDGHLWREEMPKPSNDAGAGSENPHRCPTWASTTKANNQATFSRFRLHRCPPHGKGKQMAICGGLAGAGSRCVKYR
jgi:hypothetical protein